MIRILRITVDDPLYAQEVALREDVLLRPNGLDMNAFRAEFPGFEERFEHFIALFDHPGGNRIVGCALLLPDHPEAGVGKLMQMAVDRQRQGEGIGRKLVVAIESRAFGELGLKQLYCHAQLPAEGFYTSLGWTPCSDIFSEAGIPHRKMAIHHPDPADEPT